jgi:hypothetical protein
MIKFKQFRASLNEDDVTAQTVNNNNQQTQMARAFSAIDSEIDKWVFDLKKTMVTPPSVSPPTGQVGGQAGTGQAGQRGVWDRFKNFLANVRHGRYDPKNPYRWQNTIGDYLGQKVEESVSPSNLSLSDYKKLRTICEDMEQDLQSLPTGAEKLHIIRIIDSKSAQLKNVIRDILSRLFPAEPQQEKEPELQTQQEPELEQEPDTRTRKRFVRVSGADDLENRRRRGRPPKKLTSLQEPDAPEQASEPNASIPKQEPDTLEPSTLEPDASIPKQEPDTLEPSTLEPDASIPTKEKKWSDLNNDEKARTPPPKGEKDTWTALGANKKHWNEYGGGKSELKSDAEILNVRNFRFPFPIIFRIGDPRTKIVKDALESAETNNPEIFADILNHRFEHENEINDFSDLNKKIERAKIADQNRSDKIQSNESSKKNKEELDRKIDNWKNKIDNFESELENIKGGNRDDWNVEDYDEAAKIIYQKYKEDLSQIFNKIGHESIKKESIESLNQEEKESNENYFERLNNLKEILEKSINSYKDILRPNIEENELEEFEKAGSILKLNNYYKSVIENIPESYSIIKLKERLLFKEYNQKNIKNLTVNERTEYFKKLLRNR